MTNYNLPLLRKERDWVAEQNSLPYSESALYMDAWYLDQPELIQDTGKTCGTTYCVAGHIALTTPGVEWNDEGTSMAEILVNGVAHDIESWAGEQLGISDDEATYLFHCGNDQVLDTLNELIHAAEAEEREENVA